MDSDIGIVQRVTDEAMIEGNIGIIEELVADDFVSHDPPLGVPGTKEGFRIVAQAVVSGFSDRKMEFDEPLFASDGRVLENWAMTARHTGEFLGVPPSGEEVRVRGIEIWRIKDGQIAEHWAAIDFSDLFEKAQRAAG